MQINQRVANDWRTAGLKSSLTDLGCYRLLKNIYSVLIEKDKLEIN